MFLEFIIQYLFIIFQQDISTQHVGQHQQKEITSVTTLLSSAVMLIKRFNWQQKVKKTELELIWN